MIKIKIGKGIVNKIGWLHYRSFGMELELKKSTADLTLKQIGNALAKKCGIKDGQIELNKISFNYEKRGKKIEKEKRYD